MAQAEITSAEDTLAGWQGSRTAVLIALARASGLSADLVLARRAGTRKPDAASDDVYIDPLVRFHLRNGPQKDVIASAEKDGVGLGALPAAIAREDALAVPFDAPEAAAKLFVSLPSPVVDERSTADGDVTIDEQGNLAARLVIRMGAARSTQLRAILNGIEPRGRGHFFEQLALRIFPGISEASGEVHNEGDSDQPLELVLACRAPHFLNFVGDVADMDQLVPALGLRKMYGTGGVRQQPLLLDVPLIETTKFRVRLAPGLRLVSLAADLKLENQFGGYSVTLRRTAPDTVEITRSFQLPVQVVAPEDYEQFSRFARQIDDAERQRLTVQKQ